MGGRCLYGHHFAHGVEHGAHPGAGAGAEYKFLLFFLLAIGALVLTRQTHHDRAEMNQVNPAARADRRARAWAAAAAR